jgi:hypothetical protein
MKVRKFDASSTKVGESWWKLIKVDESWIVSEKKWKEFEKWLDNIEKWLDNIEKW